jgi:hypothetical protein
MTIRTKATLKGYFNTNDIPSEANFGDLIDTLAELDADEWQDYSGISTIVGWASFTTKELRCMTIGGILFVQYSIMGTSDAISASFTIPHTSGIGFMSNMIGKSGDNGGALVAGGISVTNGSNICSLSPIVDGGAWTNTGTKIVQGQFWLKI